MNMGITCSLGWQFFRSLGLWCLGSEWSHPLWKQQGPLWASPRLYAKFFVRNLHKQRVGRLSHECWFPGELRIRAPNKVWSFCQDISRSLSGDLGEIKQGESKEHKTQGMRPRISRLLFKDSKIQETAWWFCEHFFSPWDPSKKVGSKSCLEFGQPEALTCQACGDQARNLMKIMCRSNRFMKETRFFMGETPFISFQPLKTPGNHPKYLGKRFFFLEVLRI